MSRNCLVLLGAVTLLGVSGCVSQPSERISGSISADELAEHVEFLTQPGLKGRAAGSWESGAVRTYLSRRLELHGCEPWGASSSFVQDFGFGKNVVGILPGSDPELAGEIVLISAHYDHLPPKWFSYYPGACDNAAAVAALLEIAESLSQRKTRPKRTVCFAFFDAEEKACLGSFAFTCREDYDDERVVAAINMDMLGRDLLDAVENLLVVTGTEHYRPIRQLAAKACEEQSLDFLGLEADLIGPVGDHTAFVSSRRPVLFFSCGINKDYHEPTDTADKLNYDKLRREAGAIEQTLLMLADGEAELFARSPAPITQDTVDMFCGILDTVRVRQDLFKFDPNDLECIDGMIAETRQVDLSALSHDEWVRLERQSLGKLIGLLRHYSPTMSGYSEGFMQASRYYAFAPQAASEAFREMVRHYLTHKPSLFGSNDYEYEKAMPITAADWGLVQTGENEYLFGLMENKVRLSMDFNLLTTSAFSVGLHAGVSACKGSPQEIADYVFLETARRELEQKDDGPTGRAEEWEAVEAEVLNRLQETVAAGDPNHSNRIQSIEVMGQEFARLLGDPNTHPEIRFVAIQTLGEIRRPFAMKALAAALEDSTPYRDTPWWLYEEEFPLLTHPFFEGFVPELKEAIETAETPASQSFGQMAYEQLKELSGVDFGMDAEKWREWIETQF